MQSKSSITPNNFEFVIFELISGNLEINSIFLNHQLQKLYASYKPMARSVAYKFHLDSDLAGDILQDGIMLLLDKIRSRNFEFNPEFGFRSFLYRTFYNISANLNKRIKKYQPLEMDSPFEPVSRAMYPGESSPEVIPEGAMENKVQELLYEKMSHKAAEVLEICLIQQKTNEEGARMMQYKDESIFRKKKSQHLKTFRSRIDAHEEKELLRMAG